MTADPAERSEDAPKPEKVGGEALGAALRDDSPLAGAAPGLTL